MTSVDPAAGSQPRSGSRRSARIVRDVAGYTLIRELGEGAMGRVFLARQESLGRRVALKVLRPELADDEEFRARFDREARIAARLSHPSVVGVIDAGQDPDCGVYYIAFEYVEGGTLEALLEEGPLDERRALEIARGVAAALDQAERVSLIHRDVKPDNVLITPDGTVKLADLGVAKEAGDARAHLTRTGQVLGTPTYMAPEQALGDVELDVGADIYALGLCLWRSLTGLMPFDEDGTLGVIAVLTRHIGESLPDVRERAPHVSADAARVVAWMAARERRDRYPTAAALVEDLDRVLAGDPPLGPRAGAAARATAAIGPDRLPGGGAGRRTSSRRAAARSSSRRVAARASSRRVAPRASSRRVAAGSGPVGRTSGPLDTGLGARTIVAILVGAVALGLALAIATAPRPPAPRPPAVPSAPDPSDTGRDGRATGPVDSDVPEAGPPSDQRGDRKRPRWRGGRRGGRRGR